MQLVLGMAFLALAIVGVIGCFTTSSRNQSYDSLRVRGVHVNAAVLHSSYDPAGGDPDGWTVDTIQFHASRTVRATVGHHGNDTTEKQSGTLSVIYDRSHPSTVMPLTTYENFTPRANFAVAIAGAVASGLLAAFFLGRSLRFEWRGGRANPNGGPQR